MICRKCGHEIEDDSPFCYFCGEEFSEQANNGWDKIDQKEKQIREMKEVELNRQIANMIYTTTPSIEGHTIQKYLGILNGSAVIGTGFISDFGAAVSDLFGVGSDMYNTKLDIARDAALNKLKKAALLKGANAVVGIDMDIMTVGNNMFVVNLTGTGVVID